MVPQTHFTRDIQISPIVNGLWQLSGGHGKINPSAALRSMFDYHKAGFTTWDLADHYGPAEDIMGAFRQAISEQLGPEEAAKIKAFTKWVPQPGPMSSEVVNEAIDTSCKRMRTDSLDLLQFHWWDYSDERYIEALQHLADLQRQGKIKHLALTNFDTERLSKIVKNGIRVVSNQVQYSLVDRRPEVKMMAFCRAHRIQLLTYGTLCGGFLTDRYLNAPEPTIDQLETVSQRKYKRIIDAWGGWDLFQWLLRTLRVIADKHEASIANVAVKAIMDKPAVSGVIIGTRLSLSDNRQDNSRIFNLQLDHEDCSHISMILNQANNLYEKIGGCGDEYRKHW